jgi:hypothetical protein
VVTIWVGVGTGGSSVRVGSGEPDVTMTDGGTALGAVLAADTTGEPGSGDSTATGLGGRGDQSSTGEVVAVVAFGGAAPIPPAPPGALTGGGAGDGVPRVQPTVTANGRPRATTLKKMDLGEYRTFSTPDQRPEKLRRSRIRPEPAPGERLDQRLSGPVLSIGSHRMRAIFHGGQT